MDGHLQKENKKTQDVSITIIVHTQKPRTQRKPKLVFMIHLILTKEN